MRISYNWLREYVDVKNSAKMVGHWLTMAGLEVTSVEEKGKDSILEIEVTTNRPDWLCVVGVAREVSTITGKRLKIPKISKAFSVETRDKDVNVEIEDKLLCPRYTARIIGGLRIGPSPQWLKERLEAIGIRPVNNVVDITNFCLSELGQPLHAFDYDKLTGRAIVVRKAKKGERIITIDKVDRELNNNMLVIADEKRPVAVAGVMGGLEAEVTEATKTILLESAYFDPVSIRRTQRKLGLSTDSSYRFERGVDLEWVLFTSNRAAELMAEICGGKVGVLKDVGVKVARPNWIKLSLDKANRILDLDLTPVAAKKILESLGLKVAGAQAELRVEIPSFRRDLKREEDLIEELARIHGYDKIPTTIPKMVGHSKRVEFQRIIEEQVRDVLIQEGLDEVITYSLVSREELKKIGLEEEGIISIRNPLSSEQEAMRASLIPGVLNAARFNINRRIEDIGIFEFSKRYFKDKGYSEEPTLCILMSGRARKNWREDARVDFFEIKGVVEDLFERLGIEQYEFLNGAPSIFYPEMSASISIQQDGLSYPEGMDLPIHYKEGSYPDRKGPMGKDIIGVIGEVKKEALENFGIKKEVFVCEIEFEKLIGFVCLEKRFSPPPKFLSVTRDISLIAKSGIAVKGLCETIKESGGDLLRNVVLIDEYYGGQIPQGSRGITFSIEYLSSETQLTEEEIEGAHSRVKEALIKKFAAMIR